MDTGPNVGTTPLSRRPSTIPSSPRSIGSSVPSSPESVFSYKCQSSQRSDISSSTSLVGDDGHSEEDGAYYSDSDPHNPVPSLSSMVTSNEHTNRNGEILSAVVLTDRHDEAVTSPRTLLQTENVSYCNRLSGFHGSVPTDLPVPLSSRQNPRRTNRPLGTSSSNGSGQAESRPPPQLVRQCERKDNFVESLVGELERLEVSDDILTASASVDTTTQTIETIWPLSKAHGRASADHNLINLRTFVQEVLKRSKTSYSTLLVAIHYLIVVMSALPRYDFTMEQKTDSDGCRAMQCGRRMFLAALILASKYLQDRNYSTRAWSKISGLRIPEINANERVFLAAVEWKLHLPEPLFQRWERIVLKYSPSGHTASMPRSSPAARQTWGSIVRQLNRDLDQFDDRGMLLSDNDSGYYSAASSRGSSPHAPRNGFATQVPESLTPVPPSLPALPPMTLEPTPQDSKPDHRMLPPLQPREGPLPTPQITPQFRSFCTPAVSASGLLPRRSSMSIAVNEQRRCWEENLLDRPISWGPMSDPTSLRHCSRVPSSLSYDWSSPESMVSDVSRYPSRSSSISSAASSTCALPEPTLASGAMRRCANMKMSNFIEKQWHSQRGNAPSIMPLPSLPASPSTCGDDFFFKERPKVPATEITPIISGTHQSYARAMESNPSTASNFGMGACSNLTPPICQEDEDATPKPRATGCDDISPENSQTYEAATALVDLTFDQGTVPRHGRESARSGPLKRGRPLSINFGLHSSVRAALRPQSLEQVSADDGDSAIIIPDEAVADSWLLKGNHGSLYDKNDELWADFDRRQVESEDETRNREAAEQMMKQYTLVPPASQNTSSESLPRKKICSSNRCSESTPTQKGLSERKGGSDGHSTPAKAVRKKSNPTKTKMRGSRKPSAEMDHMLKNARDDYADMYDPSSRDGKLLYGELRSW